MSRLRVSWLDFDYPDWKDAIALTICACPPAAVMLTRLAPLALLAASVANYQARYEGQHDSLRSSCS